MKRHHSLFVGLLLLGATNAQSLSGQNAPLVGATSPTNTPHPSPKRNSAVRDFSRLPLSFERNQGQTSSRARFLSHAGESTLFLTPSEAVFSLPVQPSHPFENQSGRSKSSIGHRPVEKRARVALRMQMVGANPKATTLEMQPLAGRVNYLIGKNPQEWHTNIPTFGKVGFHEVYPGVDLVYYGNRQHLEYDFVVAPHADPEQIRLHFAGAQTITVNAAGDLRIRTQGQEMTWQKPRVYQQNAHGKHTVPARFQLKTLPDGQKRVNFALGPYDTARPLIIDPVLSYSTYLNAFGSQHSRGTTCVAVDSEGNAYLGGDVSNADFPTTSGVFQPTRPASTTTFVAKLNPTGTALIYATFLGGTDGNDDLSSIAVDSAGNAYVTGDALSLDFPTTQGAYQTHKGSTQEIISNAFVTKLDPTGASLVYSTYLGRSFHVLSEGIALDSDANAYICGRVITSDFPTTPGAFQTTYKSQGNGNAFVTKFNADGSALVYSTFLGGVGAAPGEPIGRDDDAHAIAVDSAGNAYVTGETGSSDFPITTGAFQKVNHCPRDAVGSNAFVTKLNATGSGLLYSTFLGGGGSRDSGTGIALDSSGNAYVTGIVNSVDFPTTPGAFQPTFPNAQPSTSSAAFVSKLDPTGSALVYSTYLGGSQPYPDIFVGAKAGIAVDASGNAYVVGQTNCSDFPTTVRAVQRVGKSVYNPFFTKLNATGSILLYSTYLGGSGQASKSDAAVAVALDRSGNAYITGVTYSNDFPTTPGVLQATASLTGSSGASFVTKLFPTLVFPDFNSDRSTDLLIQNASTGAIASWWMQGANRVGGAAFSLTPPTEYTLVGTGDFNGDDGITLVLQSQINNRIVFWYTGGVNHATISGGDFVNVTAVAGWSVVGIADFNGDGKSDLLFQNQTSGQIAVWFMNGPLYQGGAVLPFTPLAGWKVVGTGDFNNDAKIDIVFQNQTTGQIALWYMNGTTYLGGAVLAAVPASGWKVVGVGDYNGDGSADLLFQNSTSSLAAVWHLYNGAFAGGDTLSSALPAGFKIVGPR